MKKLNLKDFKQFKLEGANYLKGGDGHTTLNGNSNGDYIQGNVMTTADGWVGISSDGGRSFQEL